MPWQLGSWAVAADGECSGSAGLGAEWVLARLCCVGDGAVKAAQRRQRAQFSALAQHGQLGRFEGSAKTPQMKTHMRPACALDEQQNKSRSPTRTPYLSNWARRPRRGLVQLAKPPQVFGTPWA